MKDEIKVGSKWSYRPSYWKKYDSYYWYKDNPVIVTKVNKSKVYYKAEDEMLGWEDFDETKKMFLSRFDSGLRKKSKESIKETNAMKKAYKDIFGYDVNQKVK